MSQTCHKTIDAGRVIEPPPGFPVEWADDEEPTLLWSWDNFHSPLPASPMGLSVGHVTRAGVEAANRAFGRPTGGRRKVINGFVYSASPPTQEGDGKATTEDALNAEVPNLRRRWDEVYLPELERNLEEMKAVNLASLDEPSLLETLDGFLAIATRHWEIHFLVVFPVVRGMDRLKEAFAALFGEEASLDWHTLVDSSRTKTVEVNEQLAKLARRADQVPEVREAFEVSETLQDVLKTLDLSDHGKAWLRELDAFLDTYGYRPTGFDIRFPTWRDDPSFVLINVKSLIERGKVSDRARESDEERTAQRAALLESVYEKIGNNPKKREDFERVLQEAQELWPLKEDHAFYIDQATAALVRDVIVEVGRRLAVKEAVEHPEDVFYLSLNEARDLLRSPADARATVQERRAAIDAQSQLNPPRYLGTLPADGAPEDAQEALEAIGADRPSLLRGQAASEGLALGPARIVKSPEGFHKVRAGDILICRSTSPTWTPLFNVVAGLVSESGGILSHPAVVAREYKLPAVVGVHRCTEILQDGDLVRVDGKQGCVELV